MRFRTTDRMSRLHTISCLAFLTIAISGCDRALDWETVHSEASPRSALKLEAGTVKVGAQLFHVELANDIWSRNQGLMFRETLEPGDGMLFLGYPKIYPWPFWMKNTLIPLDIVWITDDLKVADVQTAPPCERDPCPQYVPKAAARYVLEVNAGEFRGRIGDPVEITSGQLLRSELRPSTTSRRAPAATATGPASR